MPAWTPITTPEQLDALDGDALVEGYHAGRADTPNYTRKDQAYWHGYLNGQVDSGRMKISNEQAQLARTVVESGYLKNLFKQKAGA